MEKGRGDDALVQKAGGQLMMPESDQARRRRRVVSFLSLALKIQAAGINRRLKEDMAATRSNPGLCRLEAD